MAAKKAPINHLSLADKIEKQHVRREHTEEQTLDLRKTLAEESLLLKDEQDEFDRINKEHKVKIDNRKSAVDFTVQSLKRGFELVTEQVYGIADHTKGNMDFFTEEGEWVSTRRLYEEEKQFGLRMNFD